MRSRPNLFAGLLAVVDLANDPVEVHDYLASFEPPVIDFNLPHATHDAPPTRNDPAVPEYGQWLAKVYDAWLAGADHRHTVRMLEDIVALSSGVRGSVETLGLAPPGIVVVESDGTIESVDTLRSAEEGGSWLGLDVFRHSFDDVLRHSKMRLRDGGKASLAPICQRCPLVEVCGGGYLPHRFSGANGYRNPSVFCGDLELLIRHVQRSFERPGRQDGRSPQRDVNIRPADQRDAPTIARLIEEIERYYGASAIQPLDEREAQMQQALFGQPPLASALLAEEGSGDSWAWPPTRTSGRLRAPLIRFSSRSCTSAKAPADMASGPS